MGWVVNATPRPLYPQERDPISIVSEAGLAPLSVWTGAENLAPAGFDPRTAQLAVSRYTDWAIADHGEGVDLQKLGNLY